MTSNRAMVARTTRFVRSEIRRKDRTQSRKKLLAREIQPGNDLAESTLLFSLSVNDRTVKIKSDKDSSRLGKARERKRKRKVQRRRIHRPSETGSDRRVGSAGKNEKSDQKRKKIERGRNAGKARDLDLIH